MAEETKVPETEEEILEETANEAVNDAEVNTEANDNAEEVAEKADKKSGRKFGKADKEKEALKEQIAQLEDFKKRQLAEFENYRNRTEKEKAQSFNNGAASVLKKILPVVDNFERGLSAVPEDKKEDPFVDGMEKIYRQLMSELEKMGVTPIEAIGKPLDVNLHSAIMQMETAEYESGVVCQELQKGYMYNETVIRPSMVAVAE